MPMKIDIVSAERLVYSDDVDVVVAPGVEGQLGILPHHAPLMTMLQPGELLLRKGKEEVSLCITGGFLEVRPDRVVVLADAAEKCEEIDLARAEAAKRRAEERLTGRAPEADLAQAHASLARAVARLKVAERHRRRRGSGLEGGG
ncbi:MAG: F0F1 ATP synthase subunit epsilon [Chloroflexi bacterium]|nr:F0F1 ATP synthase subunit epsilon [Chloroflexota bacterium]